MEDIIQFAKNTLQFDSTGHDFYHVQRVAKLAVKLYKQDNLAMTPYDEKMLLIRGLLHDTVDDKIVKNVDKQWDIIQALPTFNKLNKKDKYQIREDIEWMSYSKNLVKKHTLSCYGQYVQDADRIDALGAIGIARAFAYGGRRGQPIYDPSIEVKRSVTKEDYRNKTMSTIHHFEDKLLHLAELMNTKAGKILAEERTDIMRCYLKEFIYEWNVE